MLIVEDCSDVCYRLRDRYRHPGLAKTAVGKGRDPFDRRPPSSDHHGCRQNRELSDQFQLHLFYSFFAQMVLDAGQIVEFGKPSELLEIKGGMLKALVDESGEKEHLYAMASGTA